MRSSPGTGIMSITRRFPEEVRGVKAIAIVPLPGKLVIEKSSPIALILSVTPVGPNERGLGLSQGQQPAPSSDISIVRHSSI